MDDIPVKSQAKPSEGPGKFLGETRRALGLEPDNVAQILHLSRKHIESIEANDFDSLPEPTYVRGYLRSYSQLLNVDPKPVIESYNEAAGSWKTTTYSGLAVERQISSNDNVIRFATYGVIGVVFSLAIVWWLGEEEVSTVLHAPTEVAMVPANGQNAADSLDAALPNTADSQDGVAVPQIQSVEKTDLSAAANIAAEIKPLAQSKVVAEIAVEKEKSPISREPAREVKVVSNQANPTVAAGVRATLVITTSGPSWADIRDSNDNKLLYETIAAGRVITVEGEAPLQVFFGNATVVTLKLDGADFDFSKFKRGLTARFIVGSNSTGDSQ